MAQQAGWYHGEGDPPNTMRYWDGEQWQGEPVAQNAPIGGPPPPSAESAYSMGGAASSSNPQAIEKLSPFGYWKKCWTTGFADFEGRARRSEYGWFALINTVCAILLIIPFVILAVAFGGDGTQAEPFPDAVFFALIPFAIFLLASLVPGWAVEIRRWHDLGFSGWMMLCRLIPLVGYLVAFYVLFANSKQEPNQWGRSPKYG